MTLDTPPTSVSNIAHEGERLRMALLDEMRRAQSAAHKAAVFTDLMMFYGQAFTHMREASIKQRPTHLTAAKILHECVCGSAIFTIWQRVETPINPAEDVERMMEC